MSRSKPVKIIGIFLFLFSMALIFQNCSGWVASKGSNGSALGLGNTNADNPGVLRGDDGYHGGQLAPPTYFHSRFADENQKCPDGSNIRSTLVDPNRKGESIQLVRQDCNDFDPISISADEVFKNPNKTIAVYQDTLYVEGRQEHSRVVHYCLRPERVGANSETAARVDVVLSFVPTFKGFNLTVTESWASEFQWKSGAVLAASSTSGTTEIFSGTGNSLTSPRNLITLEIPEQGLASASYQFEAGPGVVGSRELVTGAVNDLTCYSY